MKGDKSRKKMEEHLFFFSFNNEVAWWKEEKKKIKNTRQRQRRRKMKRPGCNTENESLTENGNKHVNYEEKLILRARENRINYIQRWPFFFFRMERSE